MMVKYGYTECLTHQLCDCFLNRRKVLYGWPIMTLAVLFYSIFLISLNVISIIHSQCIHNKRIDTFNDTCWLTLNGNYTSVRKIKNIHIKYSKYFFIILFFNLTRFFSSRLFCSYSLRV